MFRGGQTRGKEPSGDPRAGDVARGKCSWNACGRGLMFFSRAECCCFLRASIFCFRRCRITSRSSGAAKRKSDWRRGFSPCPPFFFVRLPEHGRTGMEDCPSANGTMVTDVIPPSRRGEGMGWFGMAVTLAMAVGPMAGTRIWENLAFRHVFLGAAALSVLALLLTLSARVPFRRKEEAEGFGLSGPQRGGQRFIFDGVRYGHRARFHCARMGFPIRGLCDGICVRRRFCRGFPFGVCRPGEPAVGATGFGGTLKQGPLLLPACLRHGRANSFNPQAVLDSLVFYAFSMRSERLRCSSCTFVSVWRHSASSSATVRPISERFSSICFNDRWMRPCTIQSVMRLSKK